MARVPVRPDAGIAFQSLFEDAALSALDRDDADFALVKGKAINATLPASQQSFAKGSITMQLAAGLGHPLVSALPASPAQSRIRITIAAALEHAFVCPGHSFVEHAYPVWRPDLASGWQRRLVASFGNRLVG